MALVDTEDRGGVRHIVLNRPEKRNALNGEVIAELGAAVEAAAADASVRVVVLRGEGPMFSAGMDLNDLRDLSKDASQLRSFRRPLLGWWNLLEEMPKPTICQIHGAALGGAFELALACDFRTMAEDAVAGIMEVRVGLLPDVGGCSRLPAAVGLAKRVLDAAAKPALALTLEQEVAAQETLAASEDFAEGARAFFEKRDPDFVGK